MRLRYVSAVTEALYFLDPLKRLPGVVVDFIPRIPAVDVNGDRDEVLARLYPYHADRVEATFGKRDWTRAEQVHGNLVAVVDGSPARLHSGVDGLVTSVEDQALGIYVADCGAIWLADRVTGAIGVLHSGKKGTEQSILTEALRTMEQAFGSKPGDVVAVLGPCIRPPHYEVDFAAEIERQAEQSGIADFHDCGVDTAADLEAYYSYRMEKGRTGRMLALIMREREPSSGRDH